MRRGANLSGCAVARAHTRKHTVSFLEMKGKEATGLISFGWRRIFTREAVCSSSRGQRGEAWLCWKRWLGLQLKRLGVCAVHHICVLCTTKQVERPLPTPTSMQNALRKLFGWEFIRRTLPFIFIFLFSFLFFDFHFLASSSLWIQLLRVNNCVSITHWLAQNHSK